MPGLILALQGKAGYENRQGVCSHGKEIEVEATKNRRESVRE